jgi:hypothetical protein
MAVEDIAAALVVYRSVTENRNQRPEVGGQ